MNYVVMVMGAMIALLFWQYTAQVEKRVVYEIAAQTAELTLKYKDDTARLSQENADIKAKADSNLMIAQNEYTREINAMRATYETELRNEPFDTGNAFELRLARLMCKISSSDNESRKACDIPLAEPYAPDTSLIVTVTSDTAEFWREQCELGLNDYCDYSLVGITPQGALTILDYMNQIDRYIQQWKTTSEYDGKIIDALTKEDP